VTSGPAWRRLGSVPFVKLVASRLELHYAAQIPAALGIARARPQPDFGHHALTWDANERALVSALVPAKRDYRAGIRFHDRALLLLDGRGARLESLALAGRTLEEGLGWLSRASAQVSGEEKPALALPGQELPAHPVAGGARFAAVDSAATTEIETWYANLAGILESLRRGESASPVRVWSHHFDLDTVWNLGGERTLGFGFSPGDEFYSEPYLYVLPSSFPEGSVAPAIEEPAEWRTSDWIGAVLRGFEVAKLPAGEQAAAIERFYRSTAAELRPQTGR
jgi:hypothetical protein